MPQNISSPRIPNYVSPEAVQPSTKPGKPVSTETQTGILHDRTPQAATVGDLIRRHENALLDLASTLITGPGPTGNAMREALKSHIDALRASRPDDVATMIVGIVRQAMHSDIAPTSAPPAARLLAQMTPDPSLGTLLRDVLRVRCNTGDQHAEVGAWMSMTPDSVRERIAHGW